METFHFKVAEDVDPSTLVYTFGGADPKAQLTPGTVVSTSTLDCFAGLVTKAGVKPSTLLDPRYLNPQTGPFYIEGAEPGDTVAVHFVSIEPRFDWGVSTTVEFFGALTGTHDTALLNEPLPENSWFYEIDPIGRLVHFQALGSDLRLPLPLDPMHGTVGVAPALGEVRSALAPGNWGGNMDTPEMRATSTCYLGVNVPGAMLSLGDGHARQGEGETCGVAVECSMNTVFIVELIKGSAPAWPRIETDEFLITTGSTKPLEDAFRIANLEMVNWVSELLDIGTMDAYQLVSQISLSPAANVVDTVYTMVCKVPKALLGPTAAAAFGGTHRALREKAGVWSAQQGV
jgi:acetamidase/formamidase